MRIPKRFKMHEVAGDDDEMYAWNSVLFTRGVLVASDGHVLAVVPVLSETDHTDRNLPRMDPGEKDGSSDAVLLPLAPFKAATQGKTGEGHLRLEDMPGACAAFGRPADGKPWTAAPLRDGAFPASWAEHRALRSEDAPEGARLVEVILDAERLVKAARAIGAADGLRVRFYERDGKMDPRATVLELRPAREPEGGPWAALGGQVME